MSESVTAKRIWAARTAQRFPVVLQMVASGELHLSAIAQLAKHLTEDNHRAVLARAKHRTSREIDILVAELAPKPDVPPRVRALPKPAASAVLSRPTNPSSDGAPKPAAANRSSAASNPPRAYKQVVALAPRRYKIEITVDQATHDKLRMLEDLLSHHGTANRRAVPLPAADPAVIISRAIDRLLAETLGNKATLAAQARPSARSETRRGTRRTRAIPAAIRREVWQRDGGRCTFVDQRGRRCGATRCVEYHHEMPYGKGGAHETGNIALRCRAHNQYQADLDFGRNFMRSKRRINDPRSVRNA